MSEMTFQQLVEVNRAVNNGTKYTTDIEQYGQEEFWANADQTKRGDCEDYAEAKYARLRALGWPKENLNFAICTVDGIGHAVLRVTFDSRDYICDNNLADPVPWNSSVLARYKWLCTTRDGSFLNWYAVGDTEH
jgi:predicted transglutaminase-like cysteine proteinase